MKVLFKLLWILLIAGYSSIIYLAAILGIDQAIMENPHILILDEPMNGLDKRGVEDIRKILMDLKKKGKLILLASHNPLDIDILCDCVYELDAGTIVNQRSILPR